MASAFAMILNTDVKDILPKQRRSRERRLAMIEAGAEMLSERDIEEISVSSVTARLGYSTGSFYSGFSDKTAFFIAIQKRVSQRAGEPIAQALDPDALAGLGPFERLRVCLDLALDYFRSERGALASALRHEGSLPEAWAPHRALSQAMVDALVNGLTPEQAGRLRVAVQMVFATLVNAVLHDPGPLRLNDDHLADALCNAMRPYLENTE